MHVPSLLSFVLFIYNTFNIDNWNNSDKTLAGLAWEAILTEMQSICKLESLSRSWYVAGSNTAQRTGVYAVRSVICAHSYYCILLYCCTI